MKKISKLITVLITVLIILTACSNKKNKAFIRELGDNQKNEITLTYKDNTVYTMHTVYKTNFKTSNHDTELKEHLNKLDELNKDIAGFKYHAEEKDNQLITTFDLDFDKVNYSKDKDRLAFTLSLDEERKLDHITNILKKIGYNEK